MLSGSIRKKWSHRALHWNRLYWQYTRCYTYYSLSCYSLLFLYQFRTPPPPLSPYWRPCMDNPVCSSFPGSWSSANNTRPQIHFPTMQVGSEDAKLLCRTSAYFYESHETVVAVRHYTARKLQEPILSCVCWLKNYAASVQYSYSEDRFASYGAQRWGFGLPFNDKIQTCVARCQPMNEQWFTFYQSYQPYQSSRSQQSDNTLFRQM